MKIIILLFYFLFLSNNSFADNLTEKRKVWINSNLINENANCYSYYSIKEQKLNNKTDFKDIKIAFTKNVFALGKEINIKDESLFSKVKSNFEILKKEMNNDYNNFVKLELRFENFCKKLLNKPQERLVYWSNKSQTVIK